MLIASLWLGLACQSGAGQPVYQPYSFTTLAGRASAGDDDGAPTVARFSGPRAVACDRSGNLYVADATNDTIRVVSATGVVRTLAGHPGVAGSADGAGSAALFTNPGGVAVDSAGTVYVADTGNHTVRKVTPSGMVTTLAGQAGVPGSADGAGSAARFAAPESVAVESAGAVYVADTGNSAIRVISPAGIVRTLAGEAGAPGGADGLGNAARFNQPAGVAVDSAGNVFVADTWNGTIRRITAAGLTTTLAGSPGAEGISDGVGTNAGFYLPEAVAVDNGGNVYVADGRNRTIRKITPAGVVTTLAGLAGAWGSADGVGSNARFGLPWGLAVDSAGNLYVADMGDGTIRKITPDRRVTTVAGRAGYAGHLDGTAATAVFNQPAGVARDGAGNLYVADMGDDTIRKITPAGVVTTLAGWPGASGSIDGTGRVARFSAPAGLAVDSAGNLFVADANNDTIRRITPAGVVTTLAGAARVRGTVDGTGSAAELDGPVGLAIDSAGNLYVTSGDSTVRMVTAAGVVTTLAGQAGSRGSADGTGSAAQFSNPLGVAVDNAGNLYVTDTGNNTVRTIAPGAVVTTLAGLVGGPGSVDGAGNAAQFNAPWKLAVDNTGNVFVADYRNDTIRAVTPSGVVSTLAGLAGFAGSQDGVGSTAWFKHPQGVAVDGGGNVYVADTGNNTIRKIDSSGTVTTLAGLAGAWGSADGTGSGARFNSPNDLALDGAGNLFVADSGNQRIRKITPAGVVTTLSGVALYLWDIAVDAVGNIYCASADDTIRKVSPAGRVSILAGVPGSRGSADGTGSTARFSGPVGVAVDEAGNVYVVDNDAGTLRKVTPDGQVTTLAGLADTYGNADGTGSAARFTAPWGVAVDPAGNLYVADTDNNTIRKGFPAVRLPMPPLAAGASGGSFGFPITGPAGQSLVVEASRDLANWMPIWTNTTGGPFSFRDPQSPTNSARFYRAHVP